MQTKLFIIVNDKKKKKIQKVYSCISDAHRFVVTFVYRLLKVNIYHIILLQSILAYLLKCLSAIS